MYVRPVCQCKEILFKISAVVSTACGRHSAAPTQNVERHVAINSKSGKPKRRRGKRKCDSRSSGRSDQSRSGGPPAAISGLRDAAETATLADCGGFSIGCGSDGVGVLIIRQSYASASYWRRGGFG